MGMVFCRGCGKEIHETAPTCPHCGAPQHSAAASGPRSEKDYVVTVLLCFFLGVLGVHRFYVGKIGTGILMLFTFGRFIPPPCQKSRHALLPRLRRSPRTAD